MLAMGAVLRSPEVVMGTYGSEGSGGQGVSGFVSNVLLRGGPKSELLFCGGQCGVTAACVLPVRLSTGIPTLDTRIAGLSERVTGGEKEVTLEPSCASAR
jgi:hypothetical protein